MIYANKSQTARILNVSRPTLDRLIESGAITPEINHKGTIRFNINKLNSNIMQDQNSSAISALITKGTNSIVETKIQEKDKFFKEYRETWGHPHQDEEIFLREQQLLENKKKAADEFEVKWALIGWKDAILNTTENDTDKEIFLYTAGHHPLLDIWKEWSKSEDITKTLTTLNGFAHPGNMRAAWENKKAKMEQEHNDTINSIKAKTKIEKDRSDLMALIEQAVENAMKK